jgi:hypothetical protein
VTALIHRIPNDRHVGEVRAIRRALGLPIGAPAFVFPTRTQGAGNGR